MIPRIIRGEPGNFRVRNFFNKSRQAKVVLSYKYTASVRKSVLDDYSSSVFWPKSEILPVSRQLLREYSEYKRKVYELAHFWPTQHIVEYKKFFLYKGIKIPRGSLDTATALSRSTVDSLRGTNPDAWCNELSSSCIICKHISVKCCHYRIEFLSI